MCLHARSPKQGVAATQLNIRIILVPGNIDGFVHDDPGDGFPASRVRCGALVRHVVLGGGQQILENQVGDGEVLAAILDLEYKI